MAPKQDEIIVPNPAIMISPDGEGKEPKQSDSHNSYCIGIHYGMRIAMDNNSAGVWVLRGSAENYRKYEEVELDYKARVPVYNKKDRVELIKLAGGVYYESGDSIPAWHNQTQMERILDGEIQATNGTVERAWEELKTMSNRTEALRVEALALEGLPKWIKYTFPHRLEDYPPQDSSAPNAQDLDNVRRPSSGNFSARMKGWAVVQDISLEMERSSILQLVTAPEESPESAPVNSFARTATHDDKNVGERQDSSQPVKPDASLRLIISLGYEDENDK